ncbi:hypothetical protein ACFQU3_11440 [Terrabacter sp. GCM10028922]|uniref:hypothetical protein n=1 Tax=Terrabacter sp. GCM10028922 TaxID=3273428 RepID=UPI00360DF668
MTHRLWLRNGTYRAAVTTTDAVGNTTRVIGNLTVANRAAALTVTQTSASFHSPVEYRLVGTPRSRGSLTLPGQSPQAFTIDDTGVTTVSLPLADGTYRNASATLTDFAGRTAHTAIPAVVVDTTGPALSFSADTARAPYGALLLALTAEDAARVTITAARQGNDLDHAVGPITDTLVGNGAAQTWTRALETGTYLVTTTAVDIAGNQSRQTRTVAVSKPATAGEIAAGLGILLALLGMLAALVILLWRKQHWLAAMGDRRRAAAAERAHRAAVAAAQAEYTSARATHDQAMARFHDAHRRWTSRASQLSGLVPWAAAPPLAHAGDTHGLRLRPNEQLHEVLPATLVEERTKQGRPNRVAVTAGPAVVTSERVAFRGSRNRDWLYAELEDVTVEADGTVLMSVSSRKTVSGMRLSGTPFDVERGQLLILRGIHASQGDAGAVHRDLLDEQRRYTTSEPVPPPPPPLPAILDPAGDTTSAEFGTPGEEKIVKTTGFEPVPSHVDR